jgi:AcrR family transcriptional regulator
MSRKRMTRGDSQEQTRQRLLDAAQKLFAKKGLDRTSVEDIAAAAGYSRGAFYSNFKTKGDLFIELLRRDHERADAEFSALLNDELTVEDIQARTRDIYSKLYRDTEGFMAWTEARLLSARDARFRAKLNSLMKVKRDHIVQLIEYFSKRTGSSPEMPPAIMAMGFMSLVEGVKLFAASDPGEMSPANAESVLALFVDSIMQLARLRGTPVAKEAAH